MSSETTTPFKLNKAREVTLPIALLLTLLAAVAVGYAKLTGTADKVERHQVQINSLEASERTTREILIRIDENVKDLRRTTRRDFTLP